jgi:hypothetical protein
MTTDDPQRLRREIEYTQRNLSSDVDALTEKVTPSRIVQRRTDRVRRRFTTMRDKVMGTAADTTSTAGRRAGHAASTVAEQTSSMASSAGEAISEAPQAIRRGTEGNPMAAGLIAFGLGWLASSLIPASRPEQQLADQAKEFVREHSDQLGHVASEMKDNLREPAQQAVESVKSTAQDAAGTVADETRSAAGNVTERAHDAKSTVQQNSS